MSSSIKKHVAVLPFIGPSHLMPLAKLVFKLAMATPEVLFSILITKENKALLASLALPPNVKVPEAGSSPWDNIIPAGKSRDDMMHHFLEGAPKIYEKAVEDAEDAAGGVKVSCLITDAFYTFAGEFAKKMQMKWIALWVPSPQCLSSYVYSDFIIRKYHQDNNAPSLPETTLDGIPGLSRMRIKHLPGGIQHTDKDDNFSLHLIFREYGITLPRADAVLLSSYEEVTPEPLVADLKSKLQKLLFMGSLTVSFDPPDLDSGSDSTGCLAWLDKQKHQSVMYISFGTVEGLSLEEMSALAEALEASGAPYLWSLKDHQKAHLPWGFEERTSSHGKIVPWAPQIQVLWHPSICAHVTHCGYNSVFECVVAEVPMITRPLWADNKFNGVVVEEEWGIGMTVDGGTMTKDGVLKCLKTVMEPDGEVSKKMRKNIKALKEALINAAGPMGSTCRDFNTLVEIISK